jgi:hypothetical protein
VKKAKTMVEGSKRRGAAAAAATRRSISQVRNNVPTRPILFNEQQLERNELKPFFFGL